MEVYRLHPGRTPLLVSIPHAGTFVPPDLAARMTAAALPLPDTDWHVDRLYDFAAEMGATVLVATHARYVVDVNRSPDGSRLYPGVTETGVCPAATFDGEPIWLAQQAPATAEIARRIEQYWRPYHDCLRRELEVLRDRHGAAVLWDAHSIRSRVPRLFDGELPVLNFGTNSGRSCSPELARRLFSHSLPVPGMSAVLDGRFKGGYITRTYGNPAANIQAVQLELAQRCYMDEETREYLPEQADGIRELLGGLLETAALRWQKAE